MSKSWGDGCGLPLIDSVESGLMPSPTRSPVLLDYRFATFTSHLAFGMPVRSWFRKGGRWLLRSGPGDELMEENGSEDEADEALPPTPTPTPTPLEQTHLFQSALSRVSPQTPFFLACLNQTFLAGSRNGCRGEAHQTAQPRLRHRRPRAGHGRARRTGARPCTAAPTATSPSAFRAATSAPSASSLPSPPLARSPSRPINLPD